ncbi:MAG: hypothetical protein LH480_00825 [Rubrivivax sp.]|nr:hypothetical protein [Rubrivivax sp.]
MNYTVEPRGALHHTGLRLRDNLLRQLLIVGSLCLGIALLLTAIEGRGFGTKLVYSLSIGTVCTLIVDAMRLAVAGAYDFWRRLRGLPRVSTINGWYGVMPGALLAIVLGPALGLTVADALTGYQSISLLDLRSGANRLMLALALALLGTLITVVVAGNLERLAHTRAG